MARYVFITGGVVSALGKGLATAGLGALLQARGYTVRLRKLDPYLNVDPGTMSPLEHGEVFVTDDAAETDLDLGHYERFTGVAACRMDSISAGRIYQNVIDKERRGAFLGKTIQVIPHVTNEIKTFLLHGEDEVDFMLCEIGGTVGDIEGLPFFEAIRQFRHERPEGTVAFVHVTLLPFVGTAGELKTKPVQHSVKELRSIGIQPDILLCRISGSELPDSVRRKIALFCDVRPDAVIPAPDLPSIYQVPVTYHKNGLDRKLLDCFGLPDLPAPRLENWRKIAKAVQSPEHTVKIAAIGKYVGLEDAYKSLNEALVHGGIVNHARVETNWVNAEDLEDPYRVGFNLESADGILVPGGFGTRGTAGKIAAVRFAREKNIPFFGICLGMQIAIIEIARNLAGIEQANSEEFADADDGSNDEHVIYHLEQSTDHRHPLFKGRIKIKHPPPTPRHNYEHVIYHLKQWAQGYQTVRRGREDGKGGTMRLGAYRAYLAPDSMAARIYGANMISERHRHRYEVDIRYREPLEAAGLRFTGFSPDGLLPEIVELPAHPWFFGVQFHPELKSRPFDPHPMFASFIEAALKQNRLEF